MVASWGFIVILTAVAGRMQNDPIVARSSELMRLGLMPSAQELRGGLVRWVSSSSHPFCKWLTCVP